ncbi:MAG: CvpA family protein, partial [Halomonadaceae bacterium]
IKATGLSATDRALGMFFGLARGVILVVVALALLRMTPLTEDSWWQESVTVEEFAKVEAWSRDVFGDELERLLPQEDQDRKRQAAEGAVRDATQEGARRLLQQQLSRETEQQPEPPGGQDQQ